METIEFELLKQLERCWNTLDASNLESLLSEDVVYESQHVLNCIDYKYEIIDYFHGKFLSIKKEMKSRLILINATIGFIPKMNMRPCIVLSQIIGDQLNQSTVLIEIKDSLISRIDLCFIPDPNEVIFSERKNKFN